MCVCVCVCVCDCVCECVCVRQGVCYMYVYDTDTAYCKNKSTGKWYNYDDSHVSEISANRIMVSHMTVM